MNPLEEKGRWGEDQLKAIQSRFGWLVWGVVCFVSGVFRIFVGFFFSTQKNKQQIYYYCSILYKFPLLFPVFSV